MQRADDNEEVVRERLKVYHRETSRWSSSTARPTFRAIDGAQPPDRVAERLRRRSTPSPAGRVSREVGPVIVCRSAAELEDA